MNHKVPDEPIFANVNDDDPALLDAGVCRQRTLSQFMDAFAKKRVALAAYLLRYHLSTDTILENRHSFVHRKSPHSIQPSRCAAFGLP